MGKDQSQNPERTQKKKGRSRGVRASRAALDAAMANANYRSQASVAAAIADMEGLDAPPKDIVNRVFTEKPVDRSSVNRVAKVLGVNPQTLILKPVPPKAAKPNSPTEHATENNPAPDSDSPSPSANTAQLPTAPNTEPAPTNQAPTSAADHPVPSTTAPTSPPWRLITGIAAALMTVTLLGLLLIKSEPEPTVPVANLEQTQLTILSASRESGQQWPGNDLLPQLVEQIGQQVHTTLTQTTNPKQLDSWQLLQQLNVDFLLEPEVFSTPAHLGLVVYLVGQGNKIPVYYNLWRKTNSEQITALSVPAISQATIHNLQLVLTRQPVWQAINAREVIESTLEARELLEGTPQGQSMLTAQSILHRALRLDGEFAPAQAALCEALIGESLAKSDKSLLNDAEHECEKAPLSLQEIAEVGTVWGNLYRKQGLLDKAEATFISVLNNFPNHAPALIGMAETKLARARKNNSEEEFDLAIAIAEKAEAVDPNIWRAPFTRSRIYYFRGDLPAAMAAVKDSIAVNENVSNVNNLASFEFCWGDLKLARDYYNRTRQLPFSDTLVDTQLALVEFYNGNYQNALALFQRYLDATQAMQGQEYYQVLINQADTHRYSNKTEQALTLYEEILYALEDQRLHGEQNAYIEAQIIYINSAITALNNSAAKARDIWFEKAAELLRQTTDPGAQVYLLLTFEQLQDTSVGQDIYQNLLSTCRGFVAHPGLATYALNSTLNSSLDSNTQ